MVVLDGGGQCPPYDLADSAALLPQW